MKLVHITWFSGLHDNYVNALYEELSGILEKKNYNRFSISLLSTRIVGDQFS